MKGSSDSSRGVNSPGVSERDPRQLHTERINISDSDSRECESEREDDGDLVARDDASVVPFARSSKWSDVSLRKWLDEPERSVNAFECLHIFRQIVEIVNAAHSQGVVVHNVRPSCFVVSSFNHVSFIESASCSDSGSEDGLNGQPIEVKSLSEAMQSSSVSAKDVMLKGNEEKMSPFPNKQILLIESSWYTSPEEVAGSSSTCASDIYRLGVLLFELFCSFDSGEEKTRTMSSLRHRVLPSQLLLKWPKEASFCLWLLHPEPSSRPKMSELLQSEFLNESRDNLEEREAAIELRERIEEHELLLEFLALVQQRKQEVADRLQDTVSFLSSDIEEVRKQQAILKENGNDNDGEDSSSLASRKRYRPGLKIHNAEECDDNLENEQKPDAENQVNVLLRSSRLMKNFKRLESAYFLARCGRGNALIRHSTSNEETENGWMNPFLEGFCKYLTFSKLKLKADLKQGDLLNSPNLVCSIGFDRDGEFFATAGVSKKIKVFECDIIINKAQESHYPVVEMASQSKLSSICWNTYIKSQIASSNFEGVVQVWDVTRGQVVTEMKEHEKRVWSIDFSSADPTMLASGSDDGAVKLWSINQGVSIGTIQTRANVCCVQFPLDSSRSLAFGSADHKIYYYDLRNSRTPLCTLVGHGKTISNVKFVDSTTLVSASTDNTLKLWDLSTSTSRVIDTPLHSFTGHTNLKNFVGLSVSDGYIATGSETNEVFVYHKAFPMPALSFKFAVSGNEVDDSAQFISSVCWRGQSSTLVAANSTGNIKILEMV